MTDTTPEPSAQKAIAELINQHGMSVDEISECTGISRGNLSRYRYEMVSTMSEEKLQEDLRNTVVLQNLLAENQSA